jgi:DNA-binding MarR family transcriptional regulator
VTPIHRLRDRVVWLTGRVSLRSERLIADHFAGSELRKQHYGILASLADRGPTAQAPLADRLFIDRSDLVTLLEDLEKRAYAVRTPGPHDRRRKIVAITPSGRTELKKLDQLVYAADDDLLADLTPQERVTLARLLERLLPPADREGEPGTDQGDR